MNTQSIVQNFGETLYSFLFKHIKKTGTLDKDGRYFPYYVIFEKNPGNKEIVRVFYSDLKLETGLYSVIVDNNFGVWRKYLKKNIFTFFDDGTFIMNHYNYINSYWIYAHKKIIPELFVYNSEKKCYICKYKENYIECETQIIPRLFGNILEEISDNE